MQRSLPKRLWYRLLRAAARLAGATVFQLRVRGREHWPQTGGGLVLCNHQSHFDPVLVGMTCDRQLNYLARRTLFGFLPFKLLIESLDAIPVERDGMGLDGLKETLRRLKRGEFVLVFPEGTRTPDGRVAPLKPGFSALAARARVPLIPVAIDGAWQCWPRKQRLPKCWGTIHVQIGQPITSQEVAALSDRELVAEVERRIRALYADVRAWRSDARGT